MQNWPHPVDLQSVSLVRLKKITAISGSFYMCSIKDCSQQYSGRLYSESTSNDIILD